MSTQAQFPSAQFLAEHRQFVERLAVGLARDEATAADLVQETWLAALVSGTQSIVDPRAWLATAMRRRALNLARSEGVRRGHEAQAARDEVSEDERLHERVAFQHSVVAAVLALDEPYRSVVMLRYFQSLSPAAIARRRKIAVSTVRSQLSRAHAQLREKLEEREGGREAWCMALAGFLEHSKPALFSAPVLAIVAAACAIAMGLVDRAIWIDHTPRTPVGPLAQVPSVESRAILIEPTFESARAVVVSRDVAVKAAAWDEGPSSEVLGAKSLDELCDMLKRVENELRPRLLTPPADATAAWQAKHAQEGMEFSRVLDRSRFNAEFASEVVGLHGGGAFYSFVTRSNSREDQPTIGLDHGTFTTAFFSSSRAVLLDLGERDASGMPANLSAEQAELFSALTLGPALPASDADPRLTSLLDGRQSTSAPLQLEHTYLLRGVAVNEHDILAVFVPIHEDEFGVTLAWRLLRSWQVPDPIRTKDILMLNWAPLASEARMAPMSTDGLLLLLGRIRILTTGRLMSIPGELRRQWSGRPLARVLRDFFGTRFVNIQGGGVFFDFATQSNAAQPDPDFVLQGEQLSAITAPNHPAVMLDLGVVSAFDVDETFVPPQDELTKRAWDLAWNFAWRRAPDEVAPRLTPEEYKPFVDLWSGTFVRAVVGHTYVVRKVVPGKHDQLVAFEIVAEDERGIFITWKVLKTWPI